ncbi:MAG: SGNH/GDSL hydrolase family protein [Clostridia bacterium]|nr:SGNH/GDSL hydrolase family protein [Clostridia bacterium]
MMRILFQGDSITDAWRDRENDANSGIGYSLLVKADLGFEFPGKYEFFNRGIGGNRIIDVYARIKRDIINLKPDVMSVLIGVNDVWHELEIENGIDADKYFKIYDMLIEEVKNALPNIKIMIMEPFVLKGTATRENYEYFDAEVKKRAMMSKKISEKYSLPYVELQDGFDELSKNIDASYWLYDGVHPTAMGHEYIKKEWIKAFKTLEI